MLRGKGFVSRHHSLLMQMSLDIFLIYNFITLDALYTDFYDLFALVGCLVLCRY